MMTQRNNNLQEVMQLQDDFEVQVNLSPTSSDMSAMLEDYYGVVEEVASVDYDADDQSELVDEEDSKADGGDSNITDESLKEDDQALLDTDCDRADSSAVDVEEESVDEFHPEDFERTSYVIVEGIKQFLEEDNVCPDLAQDLLPVIKKESLSNDDVIEILNEERRLDNATQYTLNKLISMTIDTAKEVEAPLGQTSPTAADGQMEAGAEHDELSDRGVRDSQGGANVPADVDSEEEARHEALHQKFSTEDTKSETAQDRHEALHQKSSTEDTKSETAQDRHEVLHQKSSTEDTKSETAQDMHEALHQKSSTEDTKSETAQDRHEALHQKSSTEDTKSETAQDRHEALHQKFSTEDTKSETAQDRHEALHQKSSTEDTKSETAQDRHEALHQKSSTEDTKSETAQDRHEALHQKSSTEDTESETAQDRHEALHQKSSTEDTKSETAQDRHEAFHQKSSTEDTKIETAQNGTEGSNQITNNRKQVAMAKMAARWLKRVKEKHLEKFAEVEDRLLKAESSANQRERGSSAGRSGDVPTYADTIDQLLQYYTHKDNHRRHLKNKYSPKWTGSHMGGEGIGGERGGGGGTRGDVRGSWREGQGDYGDTKPIPSITDVKEDCKHYLARHNISELFALMTASIVQERPEDPLTFLITLTHDMKDENCNLCDESHCQ